jgi:hypothetical protein
MVLTWSADEQTAIDEIKRAGSFASDDDAVRGALWYFARFLDVDLPLTVFALGNPPTTRAAVDDPADLFPSEEIEGFLG